MLMDGDVPFYVGKGTHAPGYNDKYRRRAEHLLESKLGKNKQNNVLKCNYINKSLLTQTFSFVVVTDNISEYDAIQMETSLIAKYKRICDGGILTNLITEQKMMASERRCKEVYQFTKDGLFVECYPSIRTAVRQLGINAGIIVNCCKGNYKTAGGFVWSYVNEFPGYKTDVVWNKQAVDCYSLDGVFISTYESAHAAAEILDVEQGAISLCINGLLISSCGFKWAKSGMPLHNREPKPFINPKKPISQYNEAGQLINTYPSIKEAKQMTGITGIDHSLAKDGQTAGGFVWKYIKESV
jgi:hypothetical protein